LGKLIAFYGVQTHKLDFGKGKEQKKERRGEL